MTIGPPCTIVIVPRSSPLFTRYNFPMDDVGHVPVMVSALLKLLSPKPGETFLDCTIGRAGHAARFIPDIGPGGRYIGFDVDPLNADFGQRRLQPIAEAAKVNVTVVHANFAHARRTLDDLGFSGVDGLIADLGLASNQLDDPARGLSFREDGPLDMRLDLTTGPPAADLLNELPEQALADLLYQYGEERLSRKIARKIVDRRRRSPIQSTRELAQLVQQAYGAAAHRTRIDPATRTFLALRIAVNRELDSLDELLGQLPRLLRHGGRAAFVSFHSLEDRRVKRALLHMEQQGLGQRLTRKPLTPDQDETSANPRSRSAKLRGFQRSPQP